MLLGELIDQLRQQFSSQWDGTRFSLITSDKVNHSSKGLYGDWQDNDLKRDVCKEYFSGMGIEAKVHVNLLRDMSRPVAAPYLG